MVCTHVGALHAQIYTCTHPADAPSAGIVSAPLWDSQSSTFAGLLTTADYINVIQYYWQNPDALQKVDKFRLSSLRDIEKALGVKPIETISIHPDRPVYEACRKMLESRARRIPVVDSDDETHRTMVVSVITQYRILKFIAVNVKETQKLRKPLREMNVGTYSDIATCYMDTPVMDVIHMLVKKSISSVPIIDRAGVVLNVFESVDVIALIKGGSYDDLNLTVGDALLKRSPVSFASSFSPLYLPINSVNRPWPELTRHDQDFPGIFTCSLQDSMSTIYDTIRKSRVHRFIVLDDDAKLKGVLTLSDVLEFTLLESIEDD
jgi:5'-AMP-activated protein kinase regulatory gamma subunit